MEDGVRAGAARGVPQRINAGASKAPVKKMTISLKKERPKLPETFEEDTWQKLQLSVRAVHDEKPVEQSFEELYKAVEDLCIHKLGQNLYARLAEECEQHIKKQVAALVSQASDPVEFLDVVEACWNTHSEQMSLIRSIFLYLDRTYVIQSCNVVSLWAMGLQLFRKHFESVPEVQRKVIAGILALVHRERKGDMVNRALLRNLLRMHTSLQIYPQFEGAFLEATETFYHEEGNAMMNQLDVPSYLLYVERRLEEEGERVGHYLDPQTRKPLIVKLDEQLLEMHAEAIISKGLETLMADNRVKDLKRLYTLIARVNGLHHIKVAFSAYVKRAGLEIVTNEERQLEMVQDLLNLKAKVDVLLEEALDGNEALAHALKDAFEALINVKQVSGNAQNKPAEAIAKFVDLQLRSGGKGASEVELEAVLDRVLTLFRYIQGKDVFEAFFKKDLAKRLLLNKSASVDAEKSMISKLKQECGSSFTNKLEGMFKDMELSRDVMTAYADSSVKKQSSGESEIAVHVLTTGYWPAYPPAPLKLPKELLDHQEAFEKFYLSKHQGRRLTWQNSLAHCWMKASFRPGSHGRKELLVSLYQASILLLFNSTDSLTLTEISEAVGMDKKDLVVTLQSLACGKTKILAKNPKGREVVDTDEFLFNSKFDSKQLRIKVNSIQLKETQEENDKTTESVFQDRQYQVDAAVVRVMKARKTLSHTLLISELFKQLKFPVTPADLKKRIESLIEREYLERDKDSPSTYTYLA